MRLRSTSAEWVRLPSARAARAAGAGGFVVLEGEAGVGKTTVVRGLAGASRERLTVTWGSCLADGGAPPLWPWRDLLDAGGRGSASAGAPPPAEAR